MERSKDFLLSSEMGKKTRLECIFPIDTIFKLIAERGCGQEGRKKDAADETRRCIFVGDVGSLTLANPPIAFTDNHPLLSCQFSLDSFIAEPHPDFFSYWLFYADIGGVNVGEGNTLGFQSDINAWKEPFELIFSRGVNVPDAWAGLIPYGLDFKFVKIDKKGIVTSEEDHSRRSWNSNSLQAWRQYLQEHPIQFTSS
jgi:hypothetical protein